MERISFQGRNLATAHRIWQKMLGDDVTIFLGMAGALSAGGLRLIVAHLIEHRYVDCLVSTGANLYHDLHETRGQHHYIGSPHADDAALAAERIDRVYDTLRQRGRVLRQRRLDRGVRRDARAAARTRRASSCTSSAGTSGRTTGNDGILTAAYRANVPIFCPAIADSSIGMGLSQARHATPAAGYIDIIGDIVESANIVIRRPRTASVVLGGGTPKNFINQASVQAEFYDDRVGGHRYALQIVTDVPALRRRARARASRRRRAGASWRPSPRGDGAGRRHDRAAAARERARHDRPRRAAQAQAARVRPVRRVMTSWTASRFRDDRFEEP